MDSLPFTRDEFFAVFVQYNEAVWPAQWALVLAGVVALLFAASGRKARTSTIILALLWLWMGAVYHIGYFRRINPAALAFGALFLLQGALLLRAAWRDAITYRPHSQLAGPLGGALAVYALLVYPAIGFVLGHRYPAAPTFGLPCPTTILTAALLLWAVPAPPRHLLVIPILWSAVGTVAALQLGMLEDLGLTAAGVVLAVHLVWRRRAGGS